MILCAKKTNAKLPLCRYVLFLTGLLILVGCVLAYRTRDLDPKYGEAKQLAFSMYNIAFTGLVTILAISLFHLDQVSNIVIQTVSVLWGSCFCSLAFVLPRLLQAQKDDGMTLAGVVSNTISAITNTNMPATSSTTSTEYRPVLPFGSSIQPEQFETGVIDDTTTENGDEQAEFDFKHTVTTPYNFQARQENHKVDVNTEAAGVIGSSRQDLMDFPLETGESSTSMNHAGVGYSPYHGESALESRDGSESVLDIGFESTQKHRGQPRRKADYSSDKDGLYLQPPLP